MEASTVVTPPSSKRVHTPPAPLLGTYSDDWEPYSPRRSSRISQRAQNRTPSPSIAPRHFAESQGTPQPKKNYHPMGSPQKKRQPKMDSVRRASGTLTSDGTAQAATSLGLPPKVQNGVQTGLSAPSNEAGMLPTPAKTPQKPPTEQNKANIKAIARNIFSINEDTSIASASDAIAPQYALDSFTGVAQVANKSFEIFTDSNERVPKQDHSLENPFYGPGATFSEPAKPKGKKKAQMVNVPGQGRVEIDEAIGREDGMVITFRGKKQFMLFADKDEITTQDEEATSPSASSRRLRSSVQPRLLFPPKAEIDSLMGVQEDDEEAVTDIEDHDDTDLNEEEVPQTPVAMVEKAAATPGSPRYAPASPPTTARVTRHGAKADNDATPMKKPKSSTSPFRGWQVSKTPPKTKKRLGNPLPEGPPAKRSKA